MASFKINGGKKLHGEITPQGAKNEAQNPTEGRTGSEKTRKPARIVPPYTWSRSEQR